MIVCVIISLFPIIANTLFGLLSADQGQHDLFRLHGVGRWTRLWKLQFPGALPAIFIGLRISAGLSVIGAIVGDFFFRRGDPGLGVLITNYQSRLQSEQMYGALILAILLGVVVFWVFGMASARRSSAAGTSPPARAADLVDRAPTHQPEHPRTKENHGQIPQGHRSPFPSPAC